MKSQIGIKGICRAFVYDDDGRLVDYAEDDNAATDWARSTLAAATIGAGLNSLPLYISLGNGTGTAQSSDQWMVGEIINTRKSYSYRATSQVFSSVITVNYQTTDPNGTFTEAGMWDGPVATTTLASAVSAGATTVTVPAGFGYVYQGQSIYISDGANSEYATIKSTTNGDTWTLVSGLQYAHASGVTITSFGGNLWNHSFFSGNGVTKAAGQQLVLQWTIYYESI